MPEGKSPIHYGGRAGQYAAQVAAVSRRYGFAGRDGAASRRPNPLHAQAAERIHTAADRI